MTYSIKDSGTTEQGEFFYMVEISETRHERFCSKNELTLDYMTDLIDRTLEIEKNIEEIDKAAKEGIEANVS